MSIPGAVEISDADLTNREPVASDKQGGKQIVYRDAATNLRSDLTASSLPSEVTRGARRAGRTGGHAGSSLPITAEGPGAALFMGYMDQTDIFFRSAQALSMDLKTLDKLVDATHSLQAR